MPAPPLPRHRRFRIEVATMAHGTKMTLGINRSLPGGTGTAPTHHTFGTPHLADDEAALFLAMLETGARELGVVLSIDYQLGRGGSAGLATRARAILAAVTATRPAPPRLAVPAPIAEYGASH